MNRPVEWTVRAARLRRRAQHMATRWVRSGRTTYVSERVDEYRGYWSAAANRIGADFKAIAPGIWEVRRGDTQVRLANYIVSVDDPVTLRIAGDKALCHRLAREAGVPVPLHGIFTLGRLSDARAFVSEHGGSWTVKPMFGSAAGLGITTHARGWPAVREAALLASLYGRQIMVERTVPAESCRLLFLGGELLHAVRRRGARLVPDGERPLRELLAGGGIPLDAATLDTLEFEGLALDEIPEPGRERVVRGIPPMARSLEELRTVYDESITHLVGAELVDELRRVVRAVGAELAGVDVLTNDPTVSLAKSGGVFLEINTTPGIHHHYHTEFEQLEHPVAVAILEHLLGHGATVPRGTTP